MGPVLAMCCQIFLHFFALCLGVRVPGIFLNKSSADLRALEGRKEKYLIVTRT